MWLYLSRETIYIMSVKANFSLSKYFVSLRSNDFKITNISNALMTFLSACLQNRYVLRLCLSLFHALTEISFSMFLKTVRVREDCSVYIQYSTTPKNLIKFQLERRITRNKPELLHCPNFCFQQCGPIYVKLISVFTKAVLTRE